VATFRQPNGDSATLVNTPTVTGPAGWTIPTCPPCSPTTGVDAGTNHISASPQIPGSVASPVPTIATFAQTGGVFSYGFQPDNVGTNGAPVYSVYNQPLFTGIAGAPTPRSYRGGPPAYPNARDGTFPNGFLGYSQGFLTLLTPAVAGTYNLSILVQTVNGPASQTFTATGGMASTTPLGVIGPASVVPDGAGGVTVNFTAPAGVTETLVDLQVLPWCSAQTGSVGTTYYTQIARGAGPQSVTFAANLGPTGSSAFGCTFAGQTIVAGDNYAVLLVGADYPAFEAGPPQNTSQTPTLAGANGQADVTLSTRQVFAY